jgi:hypothetical protein
MVHGMFPKQFGFWSENHEGTTSIFKKVKPQYREQKSGVCYLTSVASLLHYYIMIIYGTLPDGKNKINISCIICSEFTNKEIFDHVYNETPGGESVTTHCKFLPNSFLRNCPSLVRHVPDNYRPTTFHLILKDAIQRHGPGLVSKFVVVDQFEEDGTFTFEDMPHLEISFVTEKHLQFCQNGETTRQMVSKSGYNWNVRYNTETWAVPRIFSFSSGCDSFLDGKFLSSDEGLDCPDNIQRPSFYVQVNDER